MIETCKLNGVEPYAYALRAIGFSLGIDMQHYSCDLPPVGPLAFGLQKTRVRHDVLLVIDRQSRIDWRDIRYVRIKRWLSHGPTPHEQSKYEMRDASRHIV